MTEIKKRFMMYVWRMQQIGSLYSVFMLTVTLTLVLYPLVEWRFDNLFDRIGIPRSWNFLVVGTLFLLILSGAMLFGFMYDKVLKLWIMQTTVAIERNPYTKNLMNPKEILNWQYYFIPMLRSSGNEREADFMEKWNQRCLKENPMLQKEVKRILRWVNRYEMPPAESRFLPRDVELALQMYGGGRKT